MLERRPGNHGTLGQDERTDVLAEHVRAEQWLDFERHYAARELAVCT